MTDHRRSDFGGTAEAKQTGFHSLLDVGCEEKKGVKTESSEFGKGGEHG